MLIEVSVTEASGLDGVRVIVSRGLCAEKGRLDDKTGDRVDFWSGTSRARQFNLPVSRKP